MVLCQRAGISEPLKPVRDFDIADLNSHTKKHSPVQAVLWPLSGRFSRVGNRLGFLFVFVSKFISFIILTFSILASFCFWPEDFSLSFCNISSSTLLLSAFLTYPVPSNSNWFFSSSGKAVPLRLLQILLSIQCHYNSATYFIVLKLVTVQRRTLFWIVNFRKLRCTFTSINSMGCALLPQWIIIIL